MWQVGRVTKRKSGGNRLTLKIHPAGIESKRPIGTKTKTLRAEKTAKRTPKTIAIGIAKITVMSL